MADEKEELPEPANPGSPGAVQRPEDEVITPEVPELPNISAFDLTSDEEEQRHALCQAAIGYAKRGWRVVPVWWRDEAGHCHCPKHEECPSPAKHPLWDHDWPHRASSDPQEVAYWWRPVPPEPMAKNWFPRANVGIVTGASSGIFVLDVDSYAGGSTSLGNYERRWGDMPLTRIHQTSRGGQHHFFIHPGFSIRNSAAKKLGKGLDIRGENGFVVAPPSLGSHGPYEVADVHDIDPVEAPEWLLDVLRRDDMEQTGAAISGAEPAEAPGHARKYAEAALKAEAETMAAAEEGTRNDTLNTCAYSLGTLGGAGLLTEDQAWDALYTAASAAGLTDGEIRGTFLSGWRSGLQNPRAVQWQVLGGDWPRRSTTEFGLADRMVDHFGDQVRWCPDRDNWLVYRNGCWVDGHKRTGEHYAQAMIRALPFTEAESYDDTRIITPEGDSSALSPREDFLAWVGKQQSRKAVSAAAALSTGLQLMQMPQRTFDADPLVINARNGVVSLDTGELMPHSPEQRMTLQCAAEYYPGEPAPKFHMFLQRVQPDPEIRAYLQRVAGYCLTGLTVEQVMFLMQGVGANGKSVFEGLLQHVLGTYAQTMPVETLTASTVDGRIPNDVARMAGRRMLAASETKAGKALDEQKLKQLTGGDSVPARFMRGEWFEFRMIGKIWLTTNHLPRMSDDDATWRRLHLVPWPVVIPEEERDGYLQDTLIREESNGVLAWMVEGALAWRQMGLARPAKLVQAIAEYRKNEDIVAQFVSDCLVIVPPVNGATGRDATAIYSVFEGWLRQEGHAHRGQKWLTDKLKGQGYKYVNSNGWRGFPELQIYIPGLAEKP